jgi:hypothetical protein
MEHSLSVAGAMAGLDDFPDIRRTIDDAMDEGELLPNRYLNVLDKP